MLLAIDTSAGTSVAVVDSVRGVRIERGVDDTMRHAEVVGALIAECLAEVDASAADLTGVVVGMGPGPFTGLRVGIAAARVFAFARAMPLLPVVSHDAVALDHFSSRERNSDARAERILVVTDARRRELYWSVFDAPSAAGIRSGVPTRVEGPALAAPGDLPAGLLRVDAARVSAGALGVLAERMRGASLPFAANHALYLRSPDVTPSRGPKRVTS